MTGGGKEDIFWGLRTGKASQRRSLQEFSFRIQQRMRLKLGCQLLASSNSPYPRSSFKSEETGAPANELAGPPVSREPPEAGQAQQGGESTSAGCGPPAIRNFTWITLTPFAGKAIWWAMLQDVRVATAWCAQPFPLCFYLTVPEGYNSHHLQQTPPAHLHGEHSRPGEKWLLWPQGQVAPWKSVVSKPM